MGETAWRYGRKPDNNKIQELLHACRARGDAGARERLVELHLPLVESIARRYRKGGDDIQDLVQVGSIGLIQAIDRFEPGLGRDFAAYAVPNITGAIKHHIRDGTSAVRVPRRLQELRARARSSEQDLAGRLGREPTTAELASALGSEEADVAKAVEARRARSLSSLADALGARDGALDASETRLDLARALSGLDEDERRIVRLRFVEGSSNDLIARDLGISARQLSRRLGHILAKLRAALEAPGSADLDAGSPQPRITTMDAPGDGAAHVDMPYEVTLVKEQDGPEAAHWVARVEELPGCVAHGETADDAARAVSDAAGVWIGEAVARGAELPTPRRRSKHSGRLLLRMPQGLHAELARKADRESVSLNSLIVGVLAGAVGWQRGAEPPVREEAAATPARAPRRGILIANIAIVALAAAVAIMLLVVALSHGW